MDAEILFGSVAISTVLTVIAIGPLIVLNVLETVSVLHRQRNPIKPQFVDHKDDLEAIYRRLTAAAEKRERALYLAAPSAFWLAPDGPLSVPVPTPKAVFVPTARPEWGPPCPNRCGAHLLVMAEHGGEATMWSCTLCGTDFTRKGKAGRMQSAVARDRRNRRQMKELRHQMMMIEHGLVNPVSIHQPRQVFQSRMADEDYDNDLPPPPGV